MTPPPTTRLLHTADWHLGARLGEGDRHPEQELFLGWLGDLAETWRPDLLIVAGDVFDSATPPQTALQLYYRFLARLHAAGCPVLVVAGNHDSPALLEAPRELLGALRIRVVGVAPQTPEEALLELPGAVVCTVPFLRERDLRQSRPGEDEAQVREDLREGVRRHYAAVGAAARAVAGTRPLVATGHLTAVGSPGGGREPRETVIGTLGGVEAACFGGFAYVALGHIHGPGPVGGCEHIRYSGSPLPVSFAEVGQAKEVRLIEARADGALRHEARAVPTFRRLIRERARVDTLAETLRALDDPAAPLPAWVELTVEDGRGRPGLAAEVTRAAEGLNLTVLAHLVPPAETSPNGAPAEDPGVQTELRPEEVFRLLLRESGLADDAPEHAELLGSFAALLEDLARPPEEPPPPAAPAP